jgi:hypothetical protein
VKDGKKPTPYCLSSITTVVMNNNGMVDIWASDFNLDSNDNCTPKDELRYSFSSNVNQTSKTFTCADIPDGQSMTVPVEMWVTDNAGNQDFCSINIILQDNLGNACTDQLGGLLYSSGRVMSPTNLPLEDVSMYIDASLPEFPKLDVTGNDGTYLFNSLVANNDYSVSGTNTADPLNGVSTLDIVLIQRHILSLATLDSPYKIIAADINNDSKVTASDLVKLRKMILGLSNTYENGQNSWRFVTTVNGYNDAAHPFPFREHYLFDAMNNNQANKDFVGVKIGDVNLSAVYNFKEGSSENRGGGNMIVQVPQLFGTAGTQIRVPVSVHDIENFDGYQFTMNFDNSSLQLVNIESNTSSLTESNFGLHKVEEGIITTSWNGELASSENEMFTLVFDVLQNINVSDKLSISSDITPAEAYDTSMNIYGVTLNTNTENNNELQAFEIFQNKPNPFNSHTSISYYAPTNGQIAMKIFDINGRLLYNISDDVNKGYGEFIIEAKDLNTTGVMYYQIEFGDKKLTKKMISIE